MRIIQISDLHFGMHREEMIYPFLEEMGVLKPDVIMISGDMTQRAKEDQFLALRAFIDKLPGKVLTVPGNHDIPFLASRLFTPFKRYKRYISSQLISEFSNDAVNILGVNSATPFKIKDGKLSYDTLELIKRRFSNNGKLNILFFHHNLNYFSGMHHPLNNAEEFISYLKESSIHLVCTGHLHYGNVTLIARANQRQFAILHAGSLLCQRSKDNMNSYYVIDIDGLDCIVDWRVFENGVFVSKERYEIDFERVVGLGNVGPRPNLRDSN